MECQEKININPGISVDNDCQCDPMSKVIRQFFKGAFSSDSSLWQDSKLSDEQLSQLSDNLVERCVQQFNSKVLLKNGLFELQRQPTKFPVFFIEHFHFNEVIRNFFKESSLNYPSMGILIGRQLAERLVESISEHMKVENVTEKPNWKAAAFHFNSKEIVSKSINWSMRHLPLNSNSLRCPIHVSKYTNFQVKIGIKEVELVDNLSHDDNLKINQVEHAPVIMAHCILRLLKKLEFSVSYENKYIVIPQSIPVPNSNVLVVFENLHSTPKCQTSDLKREKIVMEMDALEFHTQYTDTVVILYNYARLRSILDKYNGLVAKGEYPKLPEIDKVDFSLIGDSKEELPLIFMLFMWPRVLYNLVNLEGSGKDGINLQFLFHFVQTFAKFFDSFYNRIVVIVPQNATHNFQSMIARFYLLHGIFNVFEEFLEIAGIALDGVYKSH